VSDARDELAERRQTLAAHELLAQPQFIGVVVLGVLGSLVTRAARWQIYFRPERRVPFRPLFATLAISYMASTFLPLRAGELVRALFLGKLWDVYARGILTSAPF